MKRLVTESSLHQHSYDTCVDNYPVVVHRYEDVVRWLTQLGLTAAAGVALLTTVAHAQDAAAPDAGVAPVTAPVAPVTEAPPSGDTGTAPVPAQQPAETTPPPAPPPPAPEPEPAAAFTGIRGKIVDAHTGEPLKEIVIEVAGRDDASTFTDETGEFELPLPSGKYRLLIYGDLYQRQRVRGVIVRRGVTRLDARLSEEEAVEILVVVPPDIASDAVQVVRRRKRGTVSDAISAEQISRSPDSNASDAAKRMVGATIQDNRYVIIRGLGGRYSVTLLNGVPLPSPDPDVPAAPLDLFPAALLANLTVTKTFSPDMPGNFAGGALSIETRSFPSKFTLKLKTGVAVDTEASFQKLNTYRGGSLDIFGFDDGIRALPSVIPTDHLAAGSELTSEQKTEQMTSFDDNWVINDNSVGPNASLAATVGDTLTLDQQRLGYFASVNYGHGYQHRVTHLQKPGGSDGNGGATESPYQQDDNAGIEQASVGSLFTAGWAPSAAHQVNLVTLYTHSADNSASSVSGTNDEPRNIDRTRLRFLEREMLFGQLVGESGLAHGKVILGWQANLAHVSQHEPDTRDLLRTLNDQGDWVIATDSGSGDRLFGELDDTSGGGGLDVTVPFSGIKLKAGASFLRSERDYQQRKFHFQLRKAAQELEPDQAFDPEQVGTNILKFSEKTLPADGYSATRDISAAYVMADVAQWEPVRVIAGARFEQTDLNLGQGSSLVDVGELPMTLADHTDKDILPSVNVVYAVTKDSNLRAGYSMTVARPNFRELAPTVYFDYVQGRTMEGDATLRETTIQNGDLRWETFLGETELLAASAFYKQFTDAIEQTVEQETVGFANAESARVYGLELEARMSLSRFAAPLAPFSLGANLALIQSQIDVMGNQRPLQGQSPFVANVDLGYEASRLGTQVDLLYNVFGRRVYAVGSGGENNIYEEPFHRLDLTVSQKLPKNLKLKLAATNLLAQRVLRTQEHTITGEPVDVYAYQVGVGFVGSLELSLE